MKSMKKLMLVGLVLLASVMVLAGCKNDSVPEVTPAKLVSITVTPPSRTVYSVDESFDSTGMVVTATYDDESSRKVTDWTTDFAKVTSVKGVNKEVTVSYTEGDNTVTDTFTVDVASYQFTETVQDYVYPTGETGTMSGGTYKKFGDWPQTIKAADVIVDETKSRQMGMFTAYLGNDGNYYVEAAEKAYGSEDEYKYSDGTPAGEDGTSTQWFKMEPIVWRVLTESYNSTGNALLLAENILTGGIPYYVDGNERTITGAGTDLDASNTVYPNNYKYSTIRAWLNGKYEEDDTQEQNKTYKGIGFLQTAFTEKARKDIEQPTVKNDLKSTFGSDEGHLDNLYACGDTEDKIFLLSVQEVTMSDYDFDVSSARIRVTTDYAKATGAYQSGTAGYGGLWWLRSPCYYDEDSACGIISDGSADRSDYVYIIEVGIVPALSISLEGN